MKTPNDLKQGVLDAARALGALQQQEIQTQCKLVAANKAQSQTTLALETANLELAAADLAYATGKQRQIVLASKRRQLASNERWLAMEAARRQLWTVASSGDEALILASATKFTDETRLFAQQAKCIEVTEAAQKELEGLLPQYSAACKRATETRNTAQEAAAKATAEVAQTQAAIAAIKANAAALFNREAGLVDAAHALAGADYQVFAYGFTETSELPIPGQCN